MDGVKRCIRTQKGTGWGDTDRQDGKLCKGKKGEERDGLKL